MWSVTTLSAIHNGCIIFFILLSFIYWLLLLVIVKVLSYLSIQEDMNTCSLRETAVCRFHRWSRGCRCTGCWRRRSRRRRPCSRWGRSTERSALVLPTLGRCRFLRSGTWDRLCCRGSCAGSILRHIRGGNWKKHSSVNNCHFWIFSTYL